MVLILGSDRACDPMKFYDDTQNGVQFKTDEVFIWKCPLDMDFQFTAGNLKWVKSGNSKEGRTTVFGCVSDMHCSPIIEQWLSKWLHKLNSHSY